MPVIMGRFQLLPRGVICLLASGLFFSFTLLAENAVPMSHQRLVYPVTKTVEHIDTYHGTQVADPYRWLEDLNSAETAAWVEAENKLTQEYLSKIAVRKQIHARLTQLWDYERFSLPVKRGNRYFFTRNDGLSNQSVLFVSEGLHGTPRLLLDPNKLSTDGTIAMSGWSVSDDGEKLAYGLTHAGSDWNEWKVLDVASGKIRPDHVKWVKFSGAAWAHDHSGFYYSRFDAPPEGEAFTSTNFYQKLYFHKLGDPQEKDALIYERADQKEWTFGGFVTDDGRYLIIVISKGSEPKNQIFYRDLTQPNAPVVELITGFDADYDFVDNDGSVFWLTTDNDAPQRRLIAVDVREPAREKWRTLIPASKGTLTSVHTVGEHFIANYMEDARTAVKVYDLAGKFVRDVELPQLGTAGGFGGRREEKETFYVFTNYVTPSEIYRYEVATGKSELFRKPNVAFNPKDYESRQEFYTSRDGTRVPMTIVHRKGLPLDGQRPTVLYGYGGFNVSLLPAYSVSNLVWMELGGVYAVPNLRGGGEYGSEWHEAGMQLQKQNVFDDFTTAAQWLIDHKITSPEKLAIRGGSNGGLLVGAAMTQRPDLFRAAVPAVGVMDMLRYHKFTIGWAWVTEFGSSDDPVQFPNLLKYSPLHNLKPGTRYPATLVTTGERDDRVVPSHSFKYAAALQAAHRGENPVLIRIETRTGHGAGKPTSKLIDEAADVLAFLTKELSMEFK
jgi:prolyl oligopeptidase